MKSEGGICRGRLAALIEAISVKKRLAKLLTVLEVCADGFIISPTVRQSRRTLFPRIQGQRQLKFIFRKLEDPR
jgi:hypothetical protein